MREMLRMCQIAIAIGTAAVFDAVGGADKLAFALAYAMIIDYATGFLCAAVWHKSPKTESGTLESRAGLKGLFRKSGIVLCCILAAELSIIVNTPTIRDATIIFFICNEALSIVENLGIMGVPMPPAIKSAIDALQEKNDE